MGFFQPRDYERIARDLRELFGADDRMTGMIPDTYDDPSEVRGFGSYRMPTSKEILRSIRKAGSDAGDWINESDFVRGLKLAEDNETFLDRQTYLDDGTVGSEERVRGYGLYGLKELTRGMMYGAANVPDAILGVAVDEDNSLRAPTQAAKRALAYEPTGDGEIDLALQTMHNLGQGVGEAAVTGGSASLMKKGILTAASHAPRQMMFRAPEAVKNVLPYSWQNKAHQMPHISEALAEKKLGRAMLDASTEGAAEGAMMYQIAQEENWGTDDLVTLGGLAIGTGLLDHYASELPRPMWKPVDTKRAPYEEKALERKAKQKKDMEEYAKEYGYPFKMLKQGGEDKPVEHDWMHPAENPHVPHLWRKKGEVVYDEDFNHPLYHLPEQYLDPKFEGYVNSIKKKKEREQERKKHLLLGSPIPYQLKYKKYNGELKTSLPLKDAKARDKAREIPQIDNEEIEVYTSDGQRKKRLAEHKQGLLPSDGLIFKNELRRVFGKHAQLDQTDDNTFHITLPNGIELNAKTGEQVDAYASAGEWIRRQYGMPSRATFTLKGSLDHVDGFDLIRLSDLYNSDTIQHEAVHFALNTVTTKKEKDILRQQFGDREEDQVAGVMEAIRQERAMQQKHSNPFVNRLLRKIERFGGQIKAFADNVPTAIAKRDLSYLQGRSPNEMLRDYAESFVDGSVWGREIAPVAREFIEKNREEIAETLKKRHSLLYPEQPHNITLAQRSPNIFSLLPYKNNPLQIDNSVISKILKEKHADSIDPEHIAKLPQALEHPVLIIDAKWTKNTSSKDNNDTYNFLLDMTDKNNANILVPIGFNYTPTNETVNRVKSMYGKTPSIGSLEKRPHIDEIIDMVMSDKLVYVDKDKVLNLVKAYSPKKYYRMREYLNKKLPAHVHTPETYRDFRNRRGLKPELDRADNYVDPVNR
ncbi:MAG: hypothetical protein J6B02_02295 [Selenomonadales bacterium]|nr:hypothetical protein [Selenomonadales bacterium]